MADGPSTPTAHTQVDPGLSGTVSTTSTFTINVPMVALVLGVVAAILIGGFLLGSRKER